MIEQLSKNASITDIYNKVNELVEVFNQHHHTTTEGMHIFITSSPRVKRNLLDYAEKEQPPRGE